MSLIEQIDKNRLPQHVAIIMDGNGRWAKAKGKDRSYGHQEGVVSVRKVVEAATTVIWVFLILLFTGFPQKTGIVRRRRYRR